jgi:hypothetical protein
MLGDRRKIVPDSLVHMAEFATDCRLRTRITLRWVRKTSSGKISSLRFAGGLGGLALRAFG